MDVIKYDNKDIQFNFKNITKDEIKDISNFIIILADSLKIDCKLTNKNITL